MLESRRFSATTEAETGSQEGVFLLSVRCPNKRSRKIDNTYVSDAVCNHFLGQVEEGFRGRLTLYCSACKTFFSLKSTTEGNELSLIDKNDIDFSNRIKIRIKGYQSRI